MSKPWDSLRKPVKSPISVGDWQGSGTPKITVCRFRECSLNDVILRFGNENNQSTRFMPCGLRELAEFCTELADQLEGK